MKILIGIGIVVVLLAAVLFGGGALVPRQHKASATRTFRAAPEELFRIIVDFASHPSWRPGVERMEVLPPREGRLVVRETSSQSLTLEVVECVENRRLVTRIVDEDLPFGGSWTYELAPEGELTRLTITEDGTIDPPPFRLLARFVFGYTKTMEDYLAALAVRVGESA